MKPPTLMFHQQDRVQVLWLFPPRIAGWGHHHNWSLDRKWRIPLIRGHSNSPLGFSTRPPRCTQLTLTHKRSGCQVFLFTTGRCSCELFPLLPERRGDDYNRPKPSRMVFVSLRTMHGSYIPFAKLQAIIIGDLSGAFIHPFFIYFAEVSGCHFYQHNRSDFSLLQHQGELLRTTYEALNTMRPEDDPLAYAQAQIYMSMAVMNTGNTENIKIAMAHLRKAANTIRTFNIRFVSQGTGGNENVGHEIGGYSEGAHERAVFLSKILHFEAYLSLYVMGLPGIQSFNADRDLRKVSVSCSRSNAWGVDWFPLSTSLRKGCKRASGISATIWNTSLGVNYRWVSLLHRRFFGPDIETPRSHTLCFARSVR